MSLIRLVATAPLFWLLAWPAAILCLLSDLVVFPWIRLRHGSSRPPDAPPKSYDASIIVLNYDGADFLRVLMPSLRTAVDRCPGDHEVIVVDNGSRDGSVALLANDFPWARVIALPENRFFIRGNRAGVEAASKDVLVFLNNDMRVDADFLRALLDRFGAPDLFAVTSRIEMTGIRVETGRTRMIEKRGALRQEQVEHPPGDDAGLVPVAWAGGGSTAYDRAKYLALGGFEDLYEPCYAEDLSLSYAAWKRDWHCELAMSSVVHHRHRGTSEKVFGRRHVEHLDRRNRELFFWRNVTDPGLVLRHALWSPWNAWKDARRGHHLGAQLVALLAAWPRMPSALWRRQRSRAVQQLTDREVLHRANRVAVYRRGGAARDRPLVLAIGTRRAQLPELDGLDVRTSVVPLELAEAPPPEDVFRRAPPEFWASFRDGPARETVRHLLFELDHDLVLFTDVHALALAAPFCEPGRSVVLSGNDSDLSGSFLDTLLRRASVSGPADLEPACARLLSGQRSRNAES